MTTGHSKADHTNRSFPFNSSVSSIVTFCREAIFSDGPFSELDMFSRWIKLSDQALAAHQNTRKQSGTRGRRKCKTILLAKPA